MLLRDRSSGNVCFQMFDLEDQDVAFRCHVAEFSLQKPPGRDRCWILVGQALKDFLTPWPSTRNSRWPSGCLWSR